MAHNRISGILQIASNYCKHFARPGQEKAAPSGAAFLFRELLHPVLVGLDHLLDHLAADGTGLAAGEVAVVALLQVDADFLWCVFTSKK